MIEPMSLIPVTLPHPDQFTVPMKVGQWLAETGDELHTGKPLVEILLPGINHIIESPVDGTLQQILLATDKPVQPEDQLALIAVAKDEELEQGEETT